MHQKEAQVLALESQRISHALEFLDVKMQEVRKLTENVPKMIAELKESESKLDNEWEECEKHRQEVANEIQAMALEKEVIRSCC